MKLLITTLTMIFISFGAFGKDYQWECQNTSIFKIEKTLLGKKKILYRRDGNWWHICTSKESRITDDSFNCVGDFEAIKSFLLDEVTKKIRVNFKKNNEVKEYYCFKKN